mmetsp:Transcript_10159/g.25770  ORF Transcript_10159/g.25770 Transcript_10159/m.25770 type:complete len:101 (-) Transcript_10159:111-413(-)
MGSESTVGGKATSSRGGEGLVVTVRGKNRAHGEEQKGCVEGKWRGVQAVLAMLDFCKRMRMSLKGTRVCTELSTGKGAMMCTEQHRTLCDEAKTEVVSSI